jgi:hypothetical protein
VIVTGDNRAAAKANDAAILEGIKSWFAGVFGPASAPLQLPGAMPASPVGSVLEPYGSAASNFAYHLARAQRSEDEWRADPEAARGRAYAGMGDRTETAVSVSGAASVEQTIRVDLDISLDPEIRAQLREMADSNSSFSVPLTPSWSAPLGTMDTDAKPNRGIGHM